MAGSCSSGSRSAPQVLEQAVSSTPQERIPASLPLAKSGCFSQLIPLLKEGGTYSDEGLTAMALEKRGLLNLTDYEQMRDLSHWQEVVAREGMSERDEELGFMALAMIKRKYPSITDEALQDRYEVLKAFCGRSY